MRSRALVLGPIVAIAAGLLALLPAGSAARACRDLAVGGTANHRTVTLDGCDRLTVRLVQDFDGGYAWSLARSPARSVLRLTSSRSVRTEPKGVVGGTDLHVFVFRAAGAGTTSFELVQNGPGRHSKPAGTFSLSVRVR